MRLATLKARNAINCHSRLRVLTGTLEVETIPAGLHRKLGKTGLALPTITQPKAVSGVQKISEHLVSPVGTLLILGVLGLAAVQFLLALGLGPAVVDSAYLPVFGLVAVVVALAVFAVLWQGMRQRRVMAHGDLAELPMSFFDTMTGIPNKFFFQDKVSAALSAGRNGAIIVLDLADFTNVNDRRGRAFGDVVIKETGRRLRHFAEGGGGLAARLSGDRFGLFLPHARHSGLERLCQELIALCGEPVVMGGDAIDPQINIGAVDVAGLGGLRALGYDSVISVCNFALSTAKSDGRGAFRIYNKSLEREFVDLDAMAVELPEALRSGALEVFLQPRCQLKDRALIGFEALVRWKREGSYVSAEDLIAMAEETGLIFDLDRYMIDRTIQTMADWNRRRKTSYPVSVNLSALHLRPDRGVEFILDCLHRHRLPPELLTVEVTETAHLAVLHQVKGLIGLREAGCRIAIDDFGTGYASLARLRALPADEIKIDRMLVSELTESEEARHILEAVLLLAGNLGMVVVAEGLENEAQLKRLVDLGCLYGQGYFFGHPRPALDWLADATYGPTGGAPEAQTA